jgi:hypothetical protein
MLSVPAPRGPALTPVHDSGASKEVKSPPITSLVACLTSPETEAFPSFPLADAINDTLSSTAAHDGSVEYAMPLKKAKDDTKVGKRLAALAAKEQHNICSDARRVRKRNYKEVGNSDDEQYQNEDGTIEQAKVNITEDMILGSKEEYVLVCLPGEEPRWVPRSYVMFKCRGRKAMARVQAKIDELCETPDTFGDYKKSLINDIANVEFVRCDGDHITYRLGKKTYTTTVDQLTMTEELRGFISPKEQKTPSVQLNAGGHPTTAMSRMPGGLARPNLGVSDWSARMPKSRNPKAAAFQGKKVHFKVAPPMTDLEAAAFLVSLQNRA